MICLTAIENQAAALPTGWRYTIQTLVMEKRIFSINKEQYQFSRELGSGAFGSVYSARRISDSELNVSFTLNGSFFLIQKNQWLSK